MTSSAPVRHAASPPGSADVVVVGAGVVGAACAFRLAERGLRVSVIDRTGPAAGSSSAGEGNLLVSDKLAGPELDLALHSLAAWRAYADRATLGFEFEAKGGVVVAASDEAREELATTTAQQRAAGVEAVTLPPDRLRDLEPHLAPGLVGGAWYPQDCQIQPMLAVRSLLADACRLGAEVVAGAELIGVERDPGGALCAVVTSRGRVVTSWLVLATGAVSADAARAAGTSTPVVPRRGHVLVTEPLPVLVRHKVYEAGYVADVESDDTGLRSSAVVEGTAAGPILLGSSRELVGFDRRFDVRAASEIAARAVALFPVLRDVRLIRGYLGFRPASPDHLPIIGASSTAPGVVLATGHEGAGVGLALGTADLVAAELGVADCPLDRAAFSPDRPSLRAAVAHA